jgi:hypothetical protein
VLGYYGWFKTIVVFFLLTPFQLAEAMKLPKLESLVVLSRLFPYNNLGPELYGHLLQSK